MTSDATATLLGLVAGPGEGAPLRPLIRALSAQVSIRAVREGGGIPNAVLATSPTALHAMPDWRGPTALWIGDGEQLEAFRDLPASVPHTVITPLIEAAEAARAGGAQALLVGALVDDAYRAPWMPPLLRSRWREREGLPTELVVVVSQTTPSELVVDASVLNVDPTDERLEWLLRMASAAVATPELAALALSSGCPTIVPSSVASILGVAHGAEALIDDNPTSAVAAARRLAADSETATRMSRAAHQLIARSSAHRAAEDLLRLLGINAGTTDAWHTAVARAEELGVPQASPFHRRVLSALHPFAPEGALAS